MRYQPRRRSRWSSPFEADLREDPSRGVEDLGDPPFAARLSLMVDLEGNLFCVERSAAELV